MEPMELIEQAFARSEHNLDRGLDGFPLERAAEPPGGEARSFDDILRHLVGCDLWFLSCVRIDASDAPVSREDIEAAGGEKLVALRRTLREYTLAKLRAAGDEALADPPEKYDYPSCLDLWLYAAEHDFWHAGQVQMLKMLFAHQ